jgi:hypothetical protein
MLFAQGRRLAAERIGARSAIAPLRCPLRFFKEPLGKQIIPGAGIGSAAAARRVDLLDRRSSS